MSEELVDWTVCGRKIGQASGHDQVDTYEICVYDFVPSAGYSGPVANCINLNFVWGTISTYNDAGELITESDMITAIKDCPLSVPKVGGE